LVALTQSIIMASFASRLILFDFAVIFISQFIMLMVGFILLATPLTSLFLLMTRLHHAYSYLFIHLFFPTFSNGLFLCNCFLFV